MHKPLTLNRTISLGSLYHLIRRDSGQPLHQILLFSRNNSLAVKLQTALEAPHNAGSGYSNYKKTHSVVLLAICNANNEFILVDIRYSGRQSDGSVYAKSHLVFSIENIKLSIPAGPS